MFEVGDHLAFFSILTVYGSIGYYYGFKKRKRENGEEGERLIDKIKKDEGPSVLEMCLPLIGGFMHPVILLGLPAEIFGYGVVIWLLGFAQCFAVLIVVYVIIPQLTDLDIKDVSQYFEVRFEKRLRISVHVVDIMISLCFAAIVLYVPSLAFSAATGFHYLASVVCVGMVITVYTAIGGMDLVPWLQILQSVLALVGMTAYSINTTMKIGGISKLWNFFVKGNRLGFLNLDPLTLRPSVWSVLFGGTVACIITIGLRQEQTVRLLKSAEPRKRQIAAWISVAAYIIIISIAAMMGVSAFGSNFGCLSVATHHIKTYDQVFPITVMGDLGKIPTLAGVVLGIVFSGTLSMVSGLLKHCVRIALDEMFPSNFTKYLAGGYTGGTLALFFGLITILLCSLATSLDILVLELFYGMIGVLGGPVLGLLLLGLFFPCCNWKGGLFAFVTGFIVNFALCVWGLINAQKQTLPMSTNLCFNNTTLANSVSYHEDNSDSLESAYEISFLWYGLLSTFNVIIVGCIASLITKIHDVNSNEKDSEK